MQPSGVITLLSDFGTKDPFVGVMKGVVLERFPSARLVDLTHDIAPQDVLAGAFWVNAAYRHFPAGTVHLAVVDPGVGSERAPMALEADSHWFVGPDNGLFELLRQRAVPSRARRLAAEKIGVRAPSRTFHGRDWFAPAAALLASGRVRFDDLGPAHEPSGALALPAVAERAGALEGTVLVVDRFGNLITNLEPRALPSDCQVVIGNERVACAGTYADISPGALVAYIGSFGQLEIAVRDGSAAGRLGAGPGTKVVLEGPCR